MSATGGATRSGSSARPRRRRSGSERWSVRIAERAAEVVAYNTICYATHDRQTAARNLAPNVEAMFVVGGRNSANTNRLVEICRQAGVPTYHIETADEIEAEWVAGMSVVGLTAGASTPEWIIEEVRKCLEEL